MDKPLQHEIRKLRLQEQKAVLALRITKMVSAAKDRVANTRRMITQSKTLLGKAREALESSRMLRDTEAGTVRRAPETKS